MKFNEIQWNCVATHRNPLIAKSTSAGNGSWDPDPGVRTLEYPGMDYRLGGGGGGILVPPGINNKTPGGTGRGAVVARSWRGLSSRAPQ